MDGRIGNLCAQIFLNVFWLRYFPILLFQNYLFPNNVWIAPLITGFLLLTKLAAAAVGDFSDQISTVLAI